MKLRERQPDPRIERELAAVDAALRGDWVEPDLAEIAVLSRELRDARPAAEDGFAAELDSWAADGFPSTSALSSDVEKPPARPTTRPRVAGVRFQRLRGRALRPALAGAFALVLAAVIAAGVLSSSGGPGGGTVQESKPATGAGAQGSAVSPPAGTAAQGASVDRAAPSEQITPTPTTVPPTTPVPPGTERPRNGQPQVQERSASITLSTEPSKVQSVADDVVQVTDRYHGFVDSSSVQASGDRGHASFALRIPTIHLRDALADLSDLANVVSRTEGSLNITAPYVSAGQRFTAAQAQVNALLRKLQTATSSSEIASLRRQLQAARVELASARSQLRSIKQRAGLSQLSVTITAGGSGGGWTIGDAADDAVNVLQAIGGAVLISLAVLVPLAALGALGWVGARELRRRRREAPLDR